MKPTRANWRANQSATDLPAKLHILTAPALPWATPHSLLAQMFVKVPKNYWRSVRIPCVFSGNLTKFSTAQSAHANGAVLPLRFFVENRSVCHTPVDIRVAFPTAHGAFSSRTALIQRYAAGRHPGFFLHYQFAGGIAAPLRTRETASSLRHITNLFPCIQVKGVGL